MPPSGFRGPVAFDVSISDPKARLEKWVDSYRKNPQFKGFEAMLMSAIRVVSAEESSGPEATGLATAAFECEVVPALCNAINIMHGAAVALLADMATTMTVASISREGWWEYGGVSRTLNMTYLNAIPLGSTVVADCVLRSSGRRLCVMQCVIRDKKTSKVLALAEHGKAALNEQVPPKAKGRL